MSASSNEIAIQLARTLRDYSRCPEEFRCAASTVAEALQALRAFHPEAYRSICDESGSVRRHIHLFVNGQWIAVRDIGGLERPLACGDVLAVFPAVSGG